MTRAPTSSRSPQFSSALRTSAALVFLAACTPDKDPVVAPGLPPDDASMVFDAGTMMRPDYPPTDKRPTFTMYGTVKVQDDYRWLEPSDDPAVQSWITAQASFARTALDHEPSRDALAKQLGDLLAERSPKFTDLQEANGAIFVRESLPPKQQPYLAVLKSLDDASSSRVLVDPNERDPSGKTTLDWYVPSHDGKRVAVSLSSSGSEHGDVHLFDVASGKELSDVLSYVNGGTAGGSLAWSADDKRVYFTKYLPPEKAGGRDRQQVYVHVLGTDVAKDSYVLGSDFPEISETSLETVRGSNAVLVHVALGDGGDFAQYIAADGKTFRRLADVTDRVVRAALGDDGFVYMLSRDGADRGRILRTKIAGGTLFNTETVLPEQDVALVDIVPTASSLYVDEIAGGPSQLVVIDLSKLPKSQAAQGASDPKTPPTPIVLPPVSSARDISRFGKNDIVLNVESYTEKPAFYRYHADTKALTATAIRRVSSADFSDTQVTRSTCTSADGTKVPMTILARKNAPHDGSNPAVLYGYGGFDLPIMPTFLPYLRAWLDHGGVWAVANLRGGSELGEAWHRGGMLTNKQNVFDDFYACSQELESEGITRKEKLAIYGRSNGGLLMGAELTQHPEAFRAVVAQVGIHDSLRYESTPNGAFNTTEYGTVKDPAQFAALYKYSPLHNVKDGTPYPAVLLMTGAHDPRVDPFNSRKMAARLQAATSSTEPILLRISNSTGHGAGTPLDATIAEWVDIYSFLFGELSMR